MVFFISFQHFLELETVSFMASMGVKVSMLIFSRAAQTCWLRKSSILI